MRLVLLLLAAQAFAQDVPQDSVWAQRTGLQTADVAAIRKLAGIADKPSGHAILLLDTKSLKSRDQVLLTEAGSGHCMRVHVFTRAGANWREVWSLNDIPPATEGRGICSKAPVSPRVQVTPDNRIVVEVPVMADPFIRTIPVSTYIFTWTGKTYELAEERR